MNVHFTLTGADDVAQRLEAIAARMPGVVADALYAEAEIEMGEAKRRTPVKSGELRASGIVGQPTYGSYGLGKEISVPLSFGGPAAEYALVVHEDLEAFHKVGQAKYLESTILESAPFMGRRISKRIADGAF